MAALPRVVRSRLDCQVAPKPAELLGWSEWRRPIVRQNAADYNRRPLKWKEFLSVEVRQALQYQQVIADDAYDLLVFDDWCVADTEIIE